MYDQTGNADGQPDMGFRPNSGGYQPGAGQSFHGFSGPNGQKFDPNAFHQFRSSFSGFNPNTQGMGGMGGFEDLFGDIFSQQTAGATSGGPETLMLAM